MAPLIRIARIAALGGVALLIGFHGWLFAGRLAEGELLEPAVALRWVASVALAAALLSLHRAGVPLVRGRRALVLWVMVVLLHWTATPMAERGIAVDELLVAAPSVITLAAGALLLLGAGIERLRVAPLRITTRRLPLPTVSAVRQCLLTVHAARPPPA